MVGPGGETGLLVLAMEGAFANGAVAAGDQVTFARVRIRATGLTPGATYTVTTPVGNYVFVATADVRNINFTDDVGFAPVNRVAIRFRDDFLDSLRARGEDATREAGRLSLDEVRSFLDNSVLPRLTSQGVIAFPVTSPASEGRRLGPKR